MISAVFALGFAVVMLALTLTRALRSIQVKTIQIAQLEEALTHNRMLLQRGADAMENVLAQLDGEPDIVPAPVLCHYKVTPTPPPPEPDLEDDFDGITHRRLNLE